MAVDTTLPFDFPAVGRKKPTAAFYGGRITSDGGVMLLRAVARQSGVVDDNVHRAVFGAWDEHEAPFTDPGTARNRTP